MHQRKVQLIGIGLLIILFAIVFGFIIWVGNPAQPMPEALTAMQSDSAVQVTYDDWITFTPVLNEPTVGFIFYPGGLVDPRAYAPVLRELAEHGFLTVIVPMPLNLAVLSVNRANEVIASFPQIDTWAIGGHSLGGSMAARYADEHSNLINGLMLWASYPADDNDLSADAIRVVSMNATNDSVMQITAFEEARNLLPADTRYITIDGGNHSQFGWYGLQAGDSPAIISRAEQQSLIVDSAVELLNRLSSDIAN